MIVNDEFLKKLRSSFSLNIYEVKIWTALLSRGTASAGELADISNVPRSRSYDVLESLEKKGFVVMKIGKPLKYLAVEPAEILHRVKKELQTNVDKQVQALDNVKKTNVFTELDLLYKNGISHVDPASLSGSIKGRKNIYSQIETLIGNAKKSVTIVTSVDGFQRKIESFKPVLRKLKSKGVKIKIAVPKHDSTIKLAKEIKDLAEIKHSKNVDGRFIVVDNEDVLFMIADDKSVHETYDSGIWVKSSFFAKSMEDMLNWNKMENLK